MRIHTAETGARRESTYADKLKAGNKMCDVAGCSRPARTRNGALCEAHYYRARRTGSTTDPVRQPETCSIDGCVNPTHCWSMCQMHYLRVKQHGDPGYVNEGPNNPAWTGDDATYGAVHQRVRRVRGPARRYACIDCGARAKHWSYQRRGGTVHDRMAYETDVWSFEPRCVPCHKRFDLACLAAQS